MPQFDFGTIISDLPAYNRPNIRSAISEINQLFSEGRYDEAMELANGFPEDIGGLVRNAINQQAQLAQQQQPQQPPATPTPEPPPPGTPPPAPGETPAPQSPTRSYSPPPEFQEQPVTGTYGESRLYDRIGYVQDLKRRLEAGEISVEDYLRVAQPRINEAYDIIRNTAGRGQGAANAVNPALNLLQAVGASNPVDPTAYPSLEVPQRFEQERRESILPENLPEGTRERITNEIPSDISLTSGRGQIEREAIRQEEQARRALEERQGVRRKAISDLSELLAQQQRRSFSQAVPDIAENANVSGVYRSTGFGNALAQKAADLTAATGEELARQGISNEELYAQGLGDIVDARLNAQSAGLQRAITLEDFERNRGAAEALANASKPQERGKTTGEKILGATQGAANIGTAVSAGKGGVGREPKTPKATTTSGTSGSALA